MIWREVKDGIWTISAERYKTRRPHTVPLSPAALALLGPAGAPDALCFPGRGVRPIGRHAFIARRPSQRIPRVGPKANCGPPGGSWRANGSPDCRRSVIQRFSVRSIARSADLPRYSRGIAQRPPRGCSFEQPPVHRTCANRSGAKPRSPAKSGARIVANDVQNTAALPLAVIFCVTPRPGLPFAILAGGRRACSRRGVARQQGNGKQECQSLGHDALLVLAHHRQLPSKAAERETPVARKAICPDQLPTAVESRVVRRQPIQSTTAPISHQIVRWSNTDLCEVPPIAGQQLCRTSTRRAVHCLGDQANALR